MPSKMAENALSWNRRGSLLKTSNEGGVEVRKWQWIIQLLNYLKIETMGRHDHDYYCLEITFSAL